MRQMRERNQIMVAIVGTAVAVALVLLSMNLGRLPFVNPTRLYHAQFANADGLKSGDDVRVEGVSVGSVKRVRVDGQHVTVDFAVRSGLTLGADSHASIEVATVLGNLFMQVESSGGAPLVPGATIALANTTVAYSLIGALDQFGQLSSGTNLPQLQSSLKSLAQTISGISPAAAGAALKGLSSIAATLASKQQQISSVLTAASSITETLNAHSAALVGLLTQTDEFARLLNQRQAVISQLLSDTASLGSQLSTLISRNGAQLAPLLANVNAVSAVLAKDKAQLQNAALYLGRFSNNISNATGSGPWLDLLTPTGIVPDNQLKACGTHPSGAAPCG